MKRIQQPDPSDGEAWLWWVSAVLATAALLELLTG